jgi:GH15 family glucan-1,4-alpha-glucosidase
VIFCYGALKSFTSAKSQERKICHKPEIYQNTLDQMKDFIENSCWNEEIQSYVQFPGSTDVDASLILMGRYGFLPMEDPKLRATYERIRATLSAGPGLYYRNKDLKEGAFAACTLWCVEYLAAGGGSLEEAKELLENFLSFQNELGLFSEEIDPETGHMLGNYPLAFTHFGLIQAVLAIEERSRQLKRGV